VKKKKTELNLKNKTVNKLNFNDPKLSLAKFSFYHWLLLALFTIIAIVALWQSFLPFFAELHYREGYNAGVLQNYSYAIDQLEAAVRYAPWETYYQTSLGKIYEDLAGKETNPTLRKDFVDKAIAIDEKSIAIDNLNPWYHNRLASIYLLSANDNPANTNLYLNLAEKENKLAAEYDNNNPIFHLALGFFYHRFNQLDKAKKCYEDALKIDPDLVEANYYLSEIYKSQNQPKKVIEYYQKTYAGYKNNFRKGAPDFEQASFPIVNNISLLLADYYLKNKRFKDAEFILQDFVAGHIDQSDEQAILLGKIYFFQSQWQSVGKLYEPLIFKYPNKKDLWLIYINALVRSNDFQTALDKTAFFLESHPGDSDFIKLQNFLKSRVKE
jgi:tetratricopeptide (TPR) repeat protein